MIVRKLGNFTELSSESGYIHKIGTEQYFTRGVVLVPDEYEEVKEIPKYTREEYEQKVQELIKCKYSIEDELGIQRKMINTLTTPQALSDEDAEIYSQEFIEYNSFVEDCKVTAKEILNNGKEN